MTYLNKNAELKRGYNSYIDTAEDDYGTMMDVGLLLMEEGDTFLLRVLDEVLTYEVDQILIVEPHETDELLIVEGEDLCTLITCTPYGINSHRMLVRGHRIATEEVKAVRRVTADAVQIEPVIVAPFVAAPMLLILLIVTFWHNRRMFRESVRKTLKGGDAL